MGNVRPFTEEDIPQVADLHRRVFHTGDAFTLDLQRSYRSYLMRIFLLHPWRDQGMSSLVYQEANGDIAGFLGVMPRPMSMQGRPIRAAVSSQFIVDPARRSTLAAVELLKAFFSGPQELSIADEANDASRRLWESLGGSTSLLYSLYWFRILQPAEFLLSRLSHPLVRRALTPLGRCVDAVSVRLPQSPLRQPAPSVSGEDLGREDLLACLSDAARKGPLRAEYNERSLDWLMDVLAENRGYGDLQKIAVRSAARKIVGWYLYQTAPNGLGEVLQIGADDGSIQVVLDHLFYHASRHGASALTGRFEPRFVRQFHEKNSMFHHRGHWVLVHSTRPEIMQAIQRGDAFLTRLEGEWCMRFRLIGEGSYRRRRARISYRDVPPVPMDVARTAP